ncbi:O-antigen ligase domain-containing protein [bacterium]|nr:O-antigen ligase domain-containing protein [bacterium]
MVLKINNLQVYFTDKGYPVFLKFLGIPGRNYGIFAHPNVLGEVSVVSFLYNLSSKSKLTYKLYLIIPLTCILKSGSRTSIIGLLLGTTIFFLFRSKVLSKAKQKVKFEFPLIVGLFLSGIFLVLTSFLVNVIAYLDPSSLTSRVSIWQTSLELTRDHPLIGMGWGWQYRAVESQFLNTWEASAHNQILEVLFSSGILGLIIFMILISRGFLFLSEMSNIHRILFLTCLVSGISESYIDVQYPNTITVIFFTILVQCNPRSIWSH